jgi:hypothetical protein
VNALKPSVNSAIAGSPPASAVAVCVTDISSTLLTPEMPSTRSVEPDGLENVNKPA